jgi:hypothetical protein
MKPFQLTVAQLLAAAACAVSLPAMAQAPADHSHHAAPAAPQPHPKHQSPKSHLRLHRLPKWPKGWFDDLTWTQARSR